ncbi:MarR family transcriptional regulator [Lentisphaerota bacterium WC36G]|nr:MarR family transcriptional regulator [Lentisphaerae bacterium WC36]
MPNKLNKNYEDRIIVSLRSIIRAVDIYSRKLNKLTNLTTPQLLCLDIISRSEKLTLSQLAKEVKLGGSTVNGIVDRLEDKNLVVRERSKIDRRKVFLNMTELGFKTIEKAPSVLQDSFSNSLNELPEEEQLKVTESLEQIVLLMNRQNIS